MLSLKIALRFLRSNKSQTALIVVGVAVALSVQVFVGSLLTSLQDTLVNETIGNSSQVTISSTEEDGTIDGWEVYLEVAEENDDIRAISPTVDFNGFLIKDIIAEPVLVRGWDMDRAEDIYEISDRVVEGRLPGKEGDVMIGIDLSEETGIIPGDSFTVRTPDARDTGVEVVGIFDLEVSSINGLWLITTLDTSREIFDTGNVVTSIEMQVTDVFAADTVASALQEDIDEGDLGDGVEVVDWKTQNGQLLDALTAQGSTSYMIQSFILISMIIAIASLLSITAIQKRRQIGILKAMGIRDGAAGRIFIMQGFLLGVMAGSLGLVMGLGILLSVPRGSIQLSVSWSFVIASWLVAVISATLAGLGPARKTSKLSPIEVIRDE